MLPAAHRLRAKSDFSIALKGFRRRGGPIVLHLSAGEPDRPARIGLIVNRAVGGSVVRHLVARRLRAAVRERLPLLPPGSLLVIRALPECADATVAEIGSALDAAIPRLVRAAAEAH